MTRSRQTADWGSRAGLAKIVPSSVAVGSGTGSADSTGTVTFTSVSSVSLNDIFSANYTNYKIVINAKDTSIYSIAMRLRVSNTDTSSSNYYVAGFGKGSSETTLTSLNSDPDTQWRLGTITNNNMTAIVEIGNPFATDYTSMYSIIGSLNNTNESYMAYFAGGISVTTSFTGITLIAGSSMTGTVRIYGYN